MMNEYLFRYGGNPVVQLEPLVGCHARLVNLHGDFFEKLLREFDRLASDRGLRVLLTWSRDCLEITGPRVVAIMVGDERCLVPPATDKVLAVFRTGTQTLDMGEVLRLRMGFAERVLDWGRFALKIRVRLQRWLRGTAKLRAPGNVFAIPLMPFHEEPDAPAAPICERHWEVGFLGTVGPNRMLGGIRMPQSPKAAARLAMLDAVRALQRRAPHLTVSIGCDVQPNWPPLIAPESYVKVLRDTKISLCPRGNCAETFRLSESARAGCVIITDPLPREWYFEGHPFIEIQNWRDLPALVGSLTADPAKLHELSTRSIAWWHSHLAPEPVAAYMVERLACLEGGFT